jgi:hypothetical protein
MNPKRLLTVILALSAHVTAMQAKNPVISRSNRRSPTL